MGESERLYEKRYEINFSWSVPSEGFQWDNPFPLGSDQYLVEKQNRPSRPGQPFKLPGKVYSPKWSILIGFFIEFLLVVFRVSAII